LRARLGLFSRLPRRAVPLFLALSPPLFFLHLLPLFFSLFS
jgi:hypothetical protein